MDKSKKISQDESKPMTGNDNELENKVNQVNILYSRFSMYISVYVV